jgi:hypothetical protein
MAFENVFGNIDFQAGNKSARADQQQMMQQVGMALGQYNQAKDRDLRGRQLDMQAQQDAAFNLKREAEGAAMRIASRQGTPQDAATIKAYESMNPNFYTGEFGQQKQATGLANLLGGQPNHGGAQQPGVNTLFPPNQAQPQNALANAMNIPPMPADAVGGLPDDLQAPQQDLSSLYQPSPDIAGTPYGKKQKAEFDRDIKLMEAKDMFTARKQKAATEKMRPKAEKSLIDTYQEAQNIIGTIDKAIEQISPWSAGAGSLLSFIPASAAKDLQSTLSTVQADAAFGALQQMKDNSPTGGALGAVSGSEMDLLKAARTNLQQDQSAEQLTENLNNYKKIRQRAFQNVLTAYEKDFGTVPESVRKQFGGDKKQDRDALANRMGLSGKPKITAQQAQQELARRRQIRGQ